MIISDVSKIKGANIKKLCKCNNCHRSYVLSKVSTEDFCDIDCKKMALRDYRKEEVSVNNL